MMLILCMWEDETHEPSPAVEEALIRWIVRDLSRNPGLYAEPWRWN